MRYALITGRPHDSQDFVVVVPPGDRKEVNALFKEAGQMTASPFAELHLVEVDSGSVTKRKRFADTGARLGPGAAVEVKLSEVPSEALQTIVTALQTDNESLREQLYRAVAQIADLQKSTGNPPAATTEQPGTIVEPAAALPAAGSDGAGSGGPASTEAYDPEEPEDPADLLNRPRKRR